MERTEKHVSGKNFASKELELQSGKAPSVTVIVVHNRGREILIQCIGSLFRSNYDNFHVVLVDNGSKDGSVQYIEKIYNMRLEVIRSKQNLGFTRGYNMALKGVRSKYTVLLNDDTVVDPDWLKFLVNVSEKHPSIGACQPKLKSFTDKKFFEYNGACGGMLDVYGTPFCRGRIFDLAEEDKGQYDSSMEVFWASGAAMFLNTKAVQETGLLDETFYAHMEEIDLSWRMHLLGYHIICVPQSVVYHVGGSTWAYRPPEEQMYLKHRNNLMLMLKNYSTCSIMRFFIIRMFLDAGLMTYALSKKDAKNTGCILRAYTWTLQNFKLILASRRCIQKSRRVSDKKIISTMLKGSVAIQYYLLKRRFFSDLGSLSKNGLSAIT